MPLISEEQIDKKSLYGPLEILISSTSLPLAFPAFNVLYKVSQTFSHLESKHHDTYELHTPKATTTLQ